MRTVFKTKEVSQELGVNPTTVQRWVKYFKLPCEKNEHGHYLFNDTNILQLKEIKQQLNLGLPMSQVKVTHLNEYDFTGAEDMTHNKINDVLKKFNAMTTRLENVEYQLGEKATNVVNIQLLQHRRELEKLYKLVENLKSEIEQLKAEKPKEEDVIPYKQKQKAQRNWFASFLNML
ncbi:MerR family transcriptional regulator [Pueribacillus sp. YX66]|uniref:MerR family transcriptional regulator n=1 Tax=Pueribacillus sp. YX66 TaxID=3229242 RepID=UPI00358D7804